MNFAGNPEQLGTEARLRPYNAAVTAFRVRDFPSQEVICGVLPVRAQSGVKRPAFIKVKSMILTDLAGFAISLK